MKIITISIIIGICTSACDFADHVTGSHIGQQLVDSLYRQSKLLLFQDSARTRELIRQQIKIADSIGYGHGFAKAYFLSAYLFERYDKLDLALTDYIKCLEISEKIDQPDLLLRTYANIGLVFYKARDYQDAITYFNQGKELALEQMNYFQIINFYSYMGLCFWRADDHMEALKYYKEAISIAIDNDKEKNNLSRLYNMSAMAFNDMEEFDSAKFYCNIALKAFKEGNGKEVAESQIINNLGHSYFLENNLDKAKKYFMKSLELNTANVNQIAELISIASNNLAEIALLENDTTKALEYFVLAEENTSISIFHPEIIRARINLINIHEAQNDLIIALKYSKINNKGIETLVNMIEQLRTLNIQFKLKKVVDGNREKEKQAQLQKERIFYLVIFAVLLASVITIGYKWRKYLFKWRKLKDHYNHFATIYNDFLKEYRAAIATQLKLNRELGTMSNTDLQDPREYLWKNVDDDDKKD